MAAGDTTELRIDVSPDLIQRLDALMQVQGIKSRRDFVVPLLEREIAREIHAATLLLRMCRINPLAAERTPGVPE